MARYKVLNLTFDEVQPFLSNTDAKSLGVSNSISASKSRQEHILPGLQTNKQIHNLLKRNGVFNNNEHVRKESFRNAIEQSREDYRSFANTLLRR